MYSFCIVYRFTKCKADKMSCKACTKWTQGHLFRTGFFNPKQTKSEVKHALYKLKKGLKIF